MPPACSNIPWKYLKTTDYLTFSRGKERDRSGVELVNIDVDEQILEVYKKLADILHCLLVAEIVYST